MAKDNKEMTKDNEKKIDFKTMNVYEKLHYVQSNVKQIWKDQEKKGLPYRFFQLENVIKMIKELLTKARLTYTYHMHDYDINENNNLITNKITITLIDIDKKEKVDFTDIQVGVFANFNGSGRAVEQNRGTSDTYTFKNLWCKIFMIPTSLEEDPDATQKKIKDKIEKEGMHAIDLVQSKDYGDPTKKMQDSWVNINKTILEQFSDSAKLKVLEKINSQGFDINDESKGPTINRLLLVCLDNYRKYKQQH